jgi:hypothetical protein
LPVVTQALALSIALIFAAAAIAKLGAWRELPGVIQNFRVLPRALVMPAAVLLPLLESAIALGIVIEETRPLAALSAAVLFTIFGAALALNYRRGRRHIDCGCFRSDLKQPISIAAIVRNAVLAVGAISLVPSAGVAAHAPSAWAPLTWTIAVAAALTVFLCYLSVGVLFQAPTPSYEENFHAARGRS